jgi:hypothetical protein
VTSAVGQLCGWINELCRLPTGRKSLTHARHATVLAASQIGKTVEEKIPARCGTTLGVSEAIRLIRPTPTHPITPSS